MLIRETYTFRCSMTATKSVNTVLERFGSRRTFGRLVFAQQDRHLGEDTHVRPLKTQAGFQKTNHFLKMPTAFIQLNQCRQFFGMNDDMQTTDFSLVRQSQRLSPECPE